MENAKMLNGQTVLVTGGSRGIGLAIAFRLGGLGARVSLCARNANSLETAVQQLRKAGIEALGFPADIGRSDQVTALVDSTHQAFGEIHILVNNAGIGLFRPLHEVSEAEWDRLMDTNLKGAFLISKVVAPEMIRRRTGTIVNICSLAGKNAFPGGGAYCASKWGLLGLNNCMAEELREFGIRVSAICPGSVASEFSPHAGKDVKKMLQPEDVAHAVAMLVTAAPGSFISEVLMRPTQKP
jgi:3-oxoacyl-[acyl-carrier protein] reductase